MAILVFNSGSSSLKFRLYVVGSDGELAPDMDGAVRHFGAAAEWEWRAAGSETYGRIEAHDHHEAARWVLRRLCEQPATIDAVGHRLVHGGEEFRQPVRLTPASVARLEALSTLAPLHNPPALEVIHACRAALGDTVPMVAVFDTAFHADLPAPARDYALPDDWVCALGIRRYGFHGLAHRYMNERYHALHGAGSARARVISFQLGNGCSICAVRDGRSVDTSMGYTPLEGLIMSTRCGDVDPGAITRIVATGVPADEVERRLARASGLLALSGATGDMRKLLALEAENHPGATRAIEAFCYRARWYLGAYFAVLGGADAILFGGGIGEHAPAIRARICAGMAWCGVALDPAANAKAVGVERRISAGSSGPEIHVIRVDEEILIARDTRATLSDRSV